VRAAFELSSDHEPILVNVLELSRRNVQQLPVCRVLLDRRLDQCVEFRATPEVLQALYGIHQILRYARGIGFWIRAQDSKDVVRFLPIAIAEQLFRTTAVGRPGLYSLSAR
jgi:hypothetical protein